MAKLIDTVQKWANRPFEEATGGLHTDIFRAAILMLEAGHDEASTYKLIRDAANVVTERQVPDREIHSAISYAKGRLGGTHVSMKWPKFEPLLRAEVCQKHRLVVDSLTHAEEVVQDPAFYLRKLYRPDELVCVAMSSNSFLTLPSESIATAENVHDVEYINPSPMSAPTGLTMENDISAHCLANTGPKIYQVVEFDFGAPEEHAAILWHLTHFLPLVMIVYSGSKSLHGWFNVRNQPEAIVQHFFCQAVQLGADPKMWSRCQFSRLPAGTNNKTKRQQTVLLFVPHHLSLS